MGYDRGDSFPFEIEQNGIPFGLFIHYLCLFLMLHRACVGVLKNQIEKRDIFVSYSLIK